jgi:hypothetical protein
MRVTGPPETPIIIDIQTPCPLQYRTISDKFDEARQTAPFHRANMFLLPLGLNQRYLLLALKRRLSAYRVFE